MSSTRSLRSRLVLMRENVGLALGTLASHRSRSFLTILGVFRLRRTRPDAERPYRAFGYPIIPAIYIAGAAAILIVLFIYRASTTWPGLVIVLLGVPVYFVWNRARSSRGGSPEAR